MLGACDLGGTLCTESIEPAVEVEVRDAATGAPAACNALLIVREGAYVDSAAYNNYDRHFPADTTRGCEREPDLLRLTAADERAGTYTVRVEKPGYAAWERAGVRARAGECHVETVRLEVLLERATP
jgi:hypothetical protein